MFCSGLLRCSGSKSGSNSWELSSSTISDAGGLEISAPSNYSQHTIIASPRPSISSTLDSPRPHKRSLGVSPQSQNEVETTPEHRFGGCKRLCTKSLELNSLEGKFSFAYCMVLHMIIFLICDIGTIQLF